MNFKHLTTAILGLLVAIVLLLPSQPVFAKSLYVNKDLNANSPISAYDIQSAPSYLVWQKTSSPTRYGGAGLAIDTDSETLFVTFEGYGTLDIVDASSLGILGRVTAPNARNLAGIVVDQDLQKVYTVDRNTNHLYVYRWNSTTHTLTNDITASPFYVPLPGLSTSAPRGAYGIALDEVNDLLYVADNSSTVKVYSTATWLLTGTVGLSAQTPMAVALDVNNGLMYTGNAHPYYGCTNVLVKTDMTTTPSPTESLVDISTLTGGVSTDCVVGIAVDPLTSLVYITTGNQGMGGSDRIIVFDPALNALHFTGDIGNPTGIVVPGKEISYNPLNLMKGDGLADDECALSGADLTYAICYDNVINNFPVDNVVVSDTLPSEVTFDSAIGGNYDGLSHTVTWEIDTLVANAPEECVYVDVVLISGLVPDSTFTNSVNIVSDQTAPTTQNESTHVCANAPPDLGPLSGPVNPFAVGVSISVSGAFTDPGTADTHTAFCNWGDTTATVAVVNETNGSGTINATHIYLDAGVYTVECTVTDDDGASDTESFRYVVVFDPNAGFVTGGGWIDSPVGAYIPDLTLVGRASFGFVSKYKKGRTTPEGSTEFQFHAGNLNFHSNTYEWLVLAGPMAMYKGVGKVNGLGNFGFLLKAIDAKLTPSTDVDLFSIKIWDKDLGDQVLYDSSLGDAMDKNPSTPIGNGQIVIHKK